MPSFALPGSRVTLLIQVKRLSEPLPRLLVAVGQNSQMPSTVHHAENTLDFDWAGTNPTRITPQSYRGLFAFHKYWGKKPVELVSSLVAGLSRPGDLVVDPFLGSGAIARETHRLGRRFAGTDLNPLAAELARMTCELPDLDDFNDAVARLSAYLEPIAAQLYQLDDGGIGSHYLWDDKTLRSVWTYPNGRRSREERPPTDFDLILSADTNAYKVRGMRPLQVRQNGRINTTENMTWPDFFSGRALHIIDEILLFANAESNPRVRRALRLTLTSAMGQMSKMVFALEKKGLSKGEISASISVGSWAIGLWRPKTHFEVNAWNCFLVRSKKLAGALKKMTPTERLSVTTANLLSADLLDDGLIVIDSLSALDWLELLPDGSVSLVVTDPPHGDRIPYLELSELWNAALDFDADWEEELIVSNAPGRRKGAERYFSALSAIFTVLKIKLSPTGHIALMFNSTSAEDWQAIRTLITDAGLRLDGVLPADYSVRSLVQDNREGALKSDVVVLISQGDQPVAREVTKILQDNNLAEA